MTGDASALKTKALTSRKPAKTQGADAQSESVRIAKSLYRLRRMRARTFGADASIFGEPAWDILLNLYIAQSSGRQIMVRRAAMSGEVAQTTGLRVLVQLEERGLVFRVKDDRDNRRSFVRLSEKALSLMETCLPSVVDRTGAGNRLIKARQTEPRTAAPQFPAQTGTTSESLQDRRARKRGVNEGA